MISSSGIFYSHKKDDNFQHFCYYWVYQPTLKEGIRHIWVQNKKDMMKLIEEWNTKNPTIWQYELLDFIVP